MIRGSPRLPGALHIMRPYNEISATSRYSDKDIKDIGRGQEQGQCHERRGGGRGRISILKLPHIYMVEYLFTPTYLQHIAAICVA